MNKGTALLASLVIIIFLGEPTFAADGTQTGYSATVSQDIVKYHRCHKIVTISGYEIKDKIDLDCWMPSFVEATEDHLVVGYSIFSDSPDELVVIINGYCEKKTYKDGTLTSSSPMSYPDCDDVKYRMREVTLTTWESWMEQQQATTTIPAAKNLPKRGSENISVTGNLPKPRSENSTFQEPGNMAKTEILPEPTSQIGTIPLSEVATKSVLENVNQPVNNNPVELESVAEPEILPNTEILQEPKILPETEILPMTEILPEPVVLPETEILPGPETLPQPTSENGKSPVFQDVSKPDLENLNTPVNENPSGPYSLPEPEILPEPKTLPGPQLSPEPEILPEPKILPETEALPKTEILPEPEILPKPTSEGGTSSVFEDVSKPDLENLNPPVNENPAVPDSLPEPEILPQPKILSEPQFLPEPEILPETEILPEPKILTEPPKILPETDILPEHKILPEPDILPETEILPDPEILPEPMSESGTIPVFEDVSNLDLENLTPQANENSTEPETLPEPEIFPDPEILPETKIVPDPTNSPAPEILQETEILPELKKLPEPTSESGTSTLFEDVSKPHSENLNPTVNTNSAEPETLSEHKILSASKILQEPTSESGTIPVSEDVPKPVPENALFFNVSISPIVKSFNMILKLIV